jgi:glyoxylase-like metal-dependent hydrolase (beta-lactamase superfamily II)
MAISRRRRWPYVLLSVGALLLLGVAMMRMGPGRFTEPDLVRDKVLRVHTQVSDIYGARIGDNVVLFDAGADAKGRAIDALLGKLGRAREDVSDLFITHGHGDHIGAVGLFARAKVHGGIGDADMMSGRGPVVPSFARVMGWLLPVPRASLNDAFVERGEAHVGGDVISAIPFAGHTPGSMLYIYDGVLFVGDSMNFTGGKLEYSPGVFNVDGAEVKKNIAGLGSLVDLTQIKTVCTGHGGCTPEADTAQLLADFIKRAQS